MSNLAMVMQETAAQPGKQELELMEQRAATLIPQDDRTEEQALLFITECKAAAKRLDTERDELVRPHLEEQRRINGIYKPVIETFEMLWERVDARLSDYRKKKQAAIEAANRKAIEDAEKARAEQERKERMAREEAERVRKEAERLEQERIEQEFQAEMAHLELERQRKAELAAAEAARKAGDVEAAREAEDRAAAAKAEAEAQEKKAEAERKASEEAQAKLAREAIKLDARADTAASKAMMTAPAIQGAAPKTVELSTGAKATGKKVPVWFFENGMPTEGEKYYGDDPRLQSIPDRFFVLDLSKLGKAVMGGEPVPGCLKDFRYVTASRTK